MIRLLIPLFVLAVLLSACSTRVISDEERKLPKIDAQASSQEGSSSSTVLIPTLPSPETVNEDSAQEEPVIYRADLSQSFIAFIGAKGDIVSHEGKFDDFDVSLTVVAGTPTALDVAVQIDSMVTDSQNLTDHLLSADFFEEETYPQAVFKATAFENTGGSTYSVSGDLTIKGTTLPVTFTADITEYYLVLTHTLDRTAFSVGGPATGLKALDASVPLEVKIVYQ